VGGAATCIAKAVTSLTTSLLALDVCVNMRWKHDNKMSFESRPTFNHQAGSEDISAVALAATLKCI